MRGMENPECIAERQVAQAALVGQWTEELLAHLAACEVCQESLSVSEMMRSLAEVPAGLPALPNAAYIWWKAELLERELAEERATRPLFIGQVTAYAAIALGFVALLWWKLPQLQHLLAGATASTLPLALTGLLLVSLSLILTLRALWLED